MEIIYCFKSKDPSSKVVADFGIRIPEWDLTLYKLKLIKTINGHLFVSAPSYKYKNKEGNEQYGDYWRFGKETAERFQEKALSLVQKHLEKEGLAKNTNENSF